MRLIKNGSMYIQKNDLEFMRGDAIEVPEKVKTVVDELLDNIYVIMTREDDFLFMSDALMKAYLIDAEWLIDFEEVENLSNKKIKSLEKEYSGQRCTYIDKMVDGELGEDLQEELSIVAYKYKQIARFRKSRKWHLFKGYRTSWNLP